MTAQDLFREPLPPTPFSVTPISLQPEMFMFGIGGAGAGGGGRCLAGDGAEGDVDKRGQAGAAGL